VLVQHSICKGVCTTKDTKFVNNFISETFVSFVMNPIFSSRLRLYRGALREG
jgi:hypothetical protein